MYAVIASGGKQFKVQEQDVVTMERLEGAAGEKVAFNEVLALGDVPRSGSALRSWKALKSKAKSWNISVVPS